MQIISEYSVTIIGILGVLAFTVSLITELLKDMPGIKKMPKGVCYPCILNRNRGSVIDLCCIRTHSFIMVLCGVGGICSFCCGIYRYVWVGYAERIKRQVCKIRYRKKRQTTPNGL